MTSGTLIGSYRHHGRIPWDDDVDLIVKRTDKSRLREVLSALQPEYVLYLLHDKNVPSDRLHWKFFSVCGTTCSIQIVSLAFRRHHVLSTRTTSSCGTSRRGSPTSAGRGRLSSRSFGVRSTVCGFRRRATPPPCWRSIFLTVKSGCKQIE
jgi:hypothetical protein